MYCTEPHERFFTDNLLNIILTCFATFLPDIKIIAANSLHGIHAFRVGWTQNRVLHWLIKTGWIWPNHFILCKWPFFSYIKVIITQGGGWRKGIWVWSSRVDFPNHNAFLLVCTSNFYEGFFVVFFIFFFYHSANSKGNLFNDNHHQGNAWGPQLVHHH